jgi:DNA-binding IclR family transcriptional regulator
MPKKSEADASEEPSGLDAGLSVLECFYESSEPRTLGDISSTVNLSKSRAYRILTTLKSRGYVRQETKGGPYGAGEKLENIGAAITREFSLHRAAKPIMAELSQSLRGTVVLRVLERNAQLTRDCVHSPETLRTSYPVGARLPPIYGSTGKALFAYATAESRKAMLEGIAPAIGEKLRQEADGVRTRGYAVNLEETVKGVRGVGAPILDRRDEPIAAIGISFPAFALPRNRISIVGQALIDACEAIGYQLDGRAHGRAERINSGRNG